MKARNDPEMSSSTDQSLSGGSRARGTPPMPRVLRLRDAPRYLGMNRNLFNAEVRPYITEVRIGRQGVAFDRLELDAWWEQYQSRNGRPAARRIDLKQLDPFIKRSGHSLRAHRHPEPLYRGSPRARIKSKSINLALGVVRHILNIAASEWMDESGLTWLERAPKIKLLPVTDARKPYPLSWEEQTRLFRELPDHLARMALFKVNTGCREQEVCGLRWEWEIDVPELDTTVFLIPGERVKNGEERLVVLNTVAR